MISLPRRLVSALCLTLTLCLTARVQATNPTQPSSTLPQATPFVTNPGGPVGPDTQPVNTTGFGSHIQAFGPTAGDVALARGDDNFAETSLVGKGVAGSSLNYTFYGKSYTDLYIDNNGVISFGSGISSYSPQPFPTSGLNNTPLLAPFWADVDTRPLTTGGVWYRTTQDAATLKNISTLVVNSMLGEKFRATYATIVTWDNVGYYDSQTDMLNSFQAILVSDGIQSYSLFLYPPHGQAWSVGSASNGVQPQVGFDSGDGTHFYNALGARTTATHDLWFLTNTVPPDPGVQIYRVDGTTVDAGTGPLALTNTSLSWFPTNTSGAALEPATGNWAPGVAGFTTATLPGTPAANTLVPWTNGDNAIFNPTTAGTVTITAGVTAETVTVGTSGMTFTSTSAANSLEFYKLLTASASTQVNFGGSLVVTALGDPYQQNASHTNTYANAITQGTFTFSDNSVLIPYYETAISGGDFTLLDNSAIRINDNQATTSGMNVTFDNSAGGTGGTFDLRGFSTSVGTIASTTGGIITNTGTAAGTFSAGSTASSVFAGVISDGTAALALTKTGTGTLTLASTNTYTGATTISGGTLQIGNAGTTGSIASTSVVGTGTLAFNRSDNVSFGAAITDHISLTKLGANTLTLTNAGNTAQGLVTVSAGTLSAPASGNFSALWDVTLANTAGVTLNFGSHDQTIGLLSGGGSTGGTIELGTGVLTTGTANSSEFDGNLNTGGLTKAGTGTLTLGGTNAYTGATTVSAGTLVVGTGTAGSIANTSSISVASGATLNFNLLAGTTLGTNIADAGTVSAGLGGTTASPIALSGNLTGTGKLLVSTGALLLTGSNSASQFTTTLSGGTLDIGSDGALGTGAITISGGSLRASAAPRTLSNALTLSGDFTLGWATTLTGPVTLTKSVTLTNANPDTGGPDVSAIGAGNISGAFGLTFAQGANPAAAIALNGQNTYTGGTSITSGTVLLGTSQSLGATTNALAVNGSLDLNSTSPTVGALSGSGKIYNGANGTASTLTAGSDGSSSTFSGQLLDNLGSGATGTLALTKSGAGTLTLTGANAYSGATTVTGGKLAVGNGTSGTLTTSSLAIASGSTAAFNGGTAATPSSVSGTVSGAGSLLLQGGDTLLSGSASTFTGTTTLSGGILELGNYGALGSGALTISGGTLLSNGAAGSLANRVTLSGNFTLGRATNLSGPISLTKSLTLTSANPTAGAATSSELSGAISGGFGLTFADGTNPTGAVLLTGTNTYTGATVVNSGSVTVGNGSTGSIASSSSLTIASGAKLTFNEAAGAGYAHAITDSGSLTLTGSGTAASPFSLSGALSGSGTLTITGVDTVLSGTATGFHGATTLNSGALELGANNVLGDGTLTVAGGGIYAHGAAYILANHIVAANDFTLGRDVTLSGAMALSKSLTITSDNLDSSAPSASLLSGVISGAYGLTFGNGSNPTGKIVLAGQNTYTGGTTIGSGTVTLGASASSGSASALGAASNALTVNGTLDLSGYNESIGSLSGSGTIDNGLNGSQSTLTAGIGGADATFGGSLNEQASTGTIAFTKDGAGTLTLTGTSQISGAVTVVAGSLDLTSGGSLTTGSSATIGNGGSASLLVGTGSSLSDTTGMVASTGTGTAQVSGSGASWHSSGLLTIGQGGTGSLTIANGGLVEGNQVVLGSGAGSSGTVSVTDAGSLLKADSSLTVGDQGNATLTLASGGQVTVGSSGNGTLVLANSAGSTGTLNLTGGTLAASTVTGGAGSALVNFNQSGSATASQSLTGSLRIEQNSAGTLTVTGANSFTGGTRINAGTLVLANASGSALGSGGVYVAGGATLTGTGSFSGSLENAGLFAVGNGSRAITLGAFTQDSTGVLDLEISGANSYDSLHVGTISLNGTLELSALNGVTLAAGEHFTLLNSTVISGTFSAIDLPTLGADLEWDESTLYSTGELSVISTAATDHGGDPGAVPEPSSYAAILGAAALGLAIWRRRAVVASVAR